MLSSEPRCQLILRLILGPDNLVLLSAPRDPGAEVATDAGRGGERQRLSYIIYVNMYIL